MKKPWIYWLLATRPKTLTAAFIPIFAATMLARADTQVVDWGISLYALLVAVFLQIGTNLVNDALDFKNGGDTAARLGPVRVTQSKLLAMEEVLAGGMMCFAVAVLFGIPLIFKGGWSIAVILSLSVLCGYLYTGGPKPLAYLGLGDFFVLIFFGFVSTVAVYYLQTGFIGPASFLAAAQIGLLATALIASNKRTLPVRFGKRFGRLEITALILLPFVFNLFWFQYGYFFAGLLPWAALPLGTMVITGVWKIEPSRTYNQFLGLTALLHLAFGVLLSVGFYLG
ncbi:MAG: 1,4-dihydroxy-2-naphthoate octaprenyltransferase [Waddliaceae bacterium]